MLENTFELQTSAQAVASRRRGPCVHDVHPDLAGYTAPHASQRFETPTLISKITQATSEPLHPTVICVPSSGVAPLPAQLSSNMQSAYVAGDTVGAALRQDIFIVELHTPTGQALPSIEHAGQQWFVGEPGQEFTVEVTRTRYSAKCYRAYLDVDCQDPGYVRILQGGRWCPTVVFQGWLQKTETSAGTHAFARRAFKLASCRPSQAAVTVGSTDEFEAGRINVRIWEVRRAGTSSAACDLKTAAPNRTGTDKKLPEGKKWFLAPGLKTEMGSLGAPIGSWSTIKYEKIARLPSIEVRYDSSESLYLRKVLDPSLAPHRAILRGSTNPAIAALGRDPAAAAAGASWPVGWPQQPVVPLTLNGREVGSDEVAVCDFSMCDSDDEGATPKWRAVKKQVVEVEV